MKLNLGLSLLVLARSALAHADASITCGQGGISGLEFISQAKTQEFMTEVAHDPPKPVKAMDLCSNEEIAAPMTPAFAQSLLQRLSTNHSILSNAVGIPISRLIPKGVHISLAEDDVYFGNHPGYTQTLGNSDLNVFGFGTPREDALTVYVPTSALMRQCRESGVPSVTA